MSRAPLVGSEYRTLAFYGGAAMSRDHSHTAGFYPTDLELLKRVFDVLCAESGCQPGSPDAEATALRLVNLFQSGHTSEEELLEAGRAGMQFRRAG